MEARVLCKLVLSARQLELRCQKYVYSPCRDLSVFLDKDNQFCKLKVGVSLIGESCTHLKICDESTAWFPWDLRDAAQNASETSSASEFEETFRSIADDIAVACASNPIKCEAKGLAPGVDSLDSISKRDFLEALSSSFLILTDMDSGNQDRGDQSNVDIELKKLWDSTVNGLGSERAAETYEPNNRVLGDTRILLSRPYELFWLSLLIASFVGLLLSRKGYSKDHLSSTLRILGLTSFLSYGMFASQLALLESSSGLFMKGGAMYLLPAVNFQIIWIVTGLWRLGIHLRVERLESCADNC
jgi:hypothetical protein